MSIDHKPTNPDEEKRIKDAGGYVFWDRVNGMLNVSRALGDLTFKNELSLDEHHQQVTCVPGVKTHQIDDNTEFIVIACDGVWDCMSNELIVNYIQKKKEIIGEIRDENFKVSDILGCIFDYNLPEDHGGLDRENAKPGSGTDNMSAILIFLKK